jgi:hypothetical protein
VYGFLHVLRANRETPGARPNDLALDAAGRVVRSIVKFHNIMQSMTGRRFLQDDVARYEAGCLLLVDMDDPRAGRVFPDFPLEASPLRLAEFFNTLYKTYDFRYPYVAESIAEARRVTWSDSSPAFSGTGENDLVVRLGYEPRLGGGDEEIEPKV